jgi:drug/metabolite transporter (DMT)-like permease
MASHRNARGVLLTLAGAACFVTNSALLKYTSESVPVFELMFVQSVFTLAFLLGAAAFLRIPVPVSLLGNRRILVRSIMDTLSLIVWVVGIAYMPLANASAIYMSTPLMVVVLAVIVLGERVDSLQWLAIVTGFTGVLLVVQPAGDQFTAWSVLPLLSAVFIAIRDIVTRPITKEISSLALAIAAFYVLIISVGAGTALQGWRAMPGEQYAWLAGGSALLSMSYFLLTAAMREGDLSVVSPFRYASLVFSALLGYLVWGHIPNSVALCGMALVICAGLYLLRAGARATGKSSPARL